MTTIAVDQAKNEFDDLLNRAAAGEEILITRQGTAVVRMGPAQAPIGEQAERVSMAIERIRELRKGNRLGNGVTIRAMIEEGRRR